MILKLQIMITILATPSMANAKLATKKKQMMEKLVILKIKLVMNASSKLLAVVDQV